MLDTEPDGRGKIRGIALEQEGVVVSAYTQGVGFSKEVDHLPWLAIVPDDVPEADQPVHPRELIGQSA
jgi:hypothetical protein